MLFEPFDCEEFDSAIDVSTRDIEETGHEKKILNHGEVDDEADESDWRKDPEHPRDKVTISCGFHLKEVDEKK